MNLQKQFRFSATPADLFNVWISPETIISPIVKIEVEPRIGGRFTLHAKSEDGVSIMNGRFIVMDPARVLEYSWSWEGFDEQTMVRVEFIQDGDTCIVKLNHSGFASNDSLKSHDAGWDAYFEGLERQALEG